MECQQAKKYVALNAMFEMVEDRSLGERRLHIAEGILSTTEQAVDAPTLVSRDIGTIGLEEIGPVELLSNLIFGIHFLIREALGLRVTAQFIKSGDAGVALFEAADRFVDLLCLG